MSKIFEVETTEGPFYVKASDEEQAQKHIVEQYFDDNVDSDEIYGVESVSFEAALAINIYGEQGDRVVTLKQLFDESPRTPDILTVPRQLVS
ncbi:hypothetical protein EP56_01650 [Listeriaceae bacterium FSL A5-0209]|nr:hypothetical protein EP56_01650 [Listeriaceae bacterium FSL A5-0209]